MEAVWSNKWNAKLLRNINYVHNILPYYGYLDKAAFAMSNLWSYTKKLFEDNISQLISFTFNQNSQRRCLKIKNEFCEDHSSFLIQTRAAMYFNLDISAWRTNSMEHLRSFIENWSFFRLLRFQRLYFYINDSNYEIFNDIVILLKLNNHRLDWIKVETNYLNFNQEQVWEYFDVPTMFGNKFLFPKEVGTFSLWQWVNMSNINIESIKTWRVLNLNNFDVSFIDSLEDKSLIFTNVHTLIWQSFTFNS